METTSSSQPLTSTQPLHYTTKSLVPPQPLQYKTKTLSSENLKSITIFHPSHTKNTSMSSPSTVPESPVAKDVQFAASSPVAKSTTETPSSSLVAKSSTQGSSLPVAFQSLSFTEPSSLTYGIELEFVFAFREDQLDLTHSNHDKDSIQKNLSLFTREVPPFTRFNTTLCPNHAYNSWGILPGGKEPAQPYGTQPQEILARKIRESYPDISFRYEGQPTYECKTLGRYDQWIICKEATVCGVGSQNIPKWVPHAVEEDAELWDSIGLEAMSPVFSTDKDHKEELESLVSTMRGQDTDPYSSFITNQCGFHVHVQAPSELAVIQELALLLIIYESTITLLHPPCRRPGHHVSIGMFESNCLSFINSDSLIPTRKIDCSSSSLQNAYKSISQLREDIEMSNWSASDGEKLDTLVEMMNPRRVRERLVNFTYLNRRALKGDQLKDGTRSDSGSGTANGTDNHDSDRTDKEPNNDNNKAQTEFPKTIEFRHARGSLDPQEITTWTDFCISLVRLAYCLVENPDKAVKDWDEMYLDNEGEEGEVERKRLSIEGLMRDMGIDRERREYWLERVKEWEGGIEGDEDDRSDNEEMPEDSEGEGIDWDVMEVVVEVEELEIGKGEEVG